MDEKFRAIVGVIIPRVVDLIVKNVGIDEISATNALYISKTYEMLNNEETKLWHFSPLTLYNIWRTENATGDIVLPEEGV